MTLKEHGMIPEIAGLPPLAWTSAPSHAVYDQADGMLTLTAAAGVDWRNDSLGGEQQHRASALGFAAPAAFSLSARVLVASPRTTFDAGALRVVGGQRPLGEASVSNILRKGKPWWSPS